MTVRTRFAPSPTGYLHVGGLRTALFNYLFARKHRGKFILRIEDTDQQRKVENAVERLIDMLHWAGLEYDEGPLKGGEFGPYIQSERLDIYRRYAHELLAAEHAYYCFCSPERLETIRRDQMERKLTPGYDRHCRNLDRTAAEERTLRGEEHVIRMKVPLDGEMKFGDSVRGDVVIPYSVIDDQVIVKSDGFPTYHLAVVVDDHSMGITHVIRGEEWLASTPKHILLYQYFKWPAPVHAHLPLLLNPDKSKLSKRQGDVAVEDYKSRGYLPEALINFIALLGWNPGDDRELFRLEELIETFSIEKVNKAGAVFDVEKLNWMNATYIRNLTPDGLAARVKPYISEAGFDDGDAEKLRKVTALMQPRLTTLADAAEQAAFAYSDEIEPADEESRMFLQTESTEKLFVSLIESLSAMNPVSGDDFKSLVQETGNLLGIKGKNLFMPVRVALTGKAKGPDLPLLADVLGKDTIIQRLRRWVGA